MGDDIHLRFRRPGGLRPADGTERRGGNRVGVNAVGIDFEIGITIRAENSRQRSSGHRRAGLGVSAGVEKYLRLLRHQRAVFFDAGFDFALDRMAPAGDHRFGDRGHHAHRPLRFARQRRDQRLNLAARLAAVGAADEVYMHAHFGQRRVKHLGDIGAHAERMTGGSPDRDAVAVDLGDRRVRLHRVVIDHRKVELVLDDHVRLGETFGDIAFDQLVMGANVFLGEIVQAAARRRPSPRRR